MKTPIEIIKERFPYSNTNSLYERYEVVQLIEDCIAQFQQPRLTDEEIDAMFPMYHSNEISAAIDILKPIMVKKNWNSSIQRQTARQVLDLLQSKALNATEDGEG